MTPMIEGIGLLVLAAIFGVFAIVAAIGHARERARMERIGRRGLR